MAAILIAGINYAPEETGIAPYTTGMAEHLERSGHRVTVLTGMPHYPHWSVFDGYRGQITRRERIHGVEVLRLHHYVPERQSALRRALYEGTFLVHAARLPLLRRPDMVVGVIPSLSGGVLARFLARWFHVPYGLLFQDLVGRAADQSGIEGAQRVSSSVRRLEVGLAANAARVAVIAEGFRSYLVEGGVDPRRVLRVRNWTHLAPATETRAETRARLGWGPDELVALHAGNMGYKQGLENVLRAADLARRQQRLRFVMQGDGNQRAELEAMARRLALPNLSFLPLAPSGDFPNILAAADYLLVNQRKSVRDMSLPGKLTSYFAAGVPVVAAVSPESETARELSFARAGQVVAPDDPALLLRTLQGLGDAPAERSRLGAAGRRFAEQYLGEANALAGIDRFIDETLHWNGLRGRRAATNPQVSQPILA